MERILLDYFRSCLNTIPKYPFSLKLKLMYLECIYILQYLHFLKIYYPIFYFVCELTRTFNSFTPCKWIRQINNKKMQTTTKKPKLITPNRLPKKPTIFYFIFLHSNVSTLVLKHNQSYNGTSFNFPWCKIRLIYVLS